MAIKANNIIVGGAVSAPPTPKKKAEPVKSKKLTSVADRVIPEQTETKQLPKYISKEDGLLVRKINTKSQYMRDIFELDS